METAPQVGQPLPAVETGLGRAGAMAFEQRHRPGDGDVPAEVFGDLLGLVEAPLALAYRMHGAGNQQIGAAPGFPRQSADDLVREPLDQRLTQGTLALVLIAADQLVDGKLVAPGHNHPLEGRRRPQAFAADHLHRAGKRQREGAAPALAPIERQISLAIPAQTMAPDAGEAGDTLAGPAPQALLPPD